MFKPLSLFIGMRYTQLKTNNHFISFISRVSMIGIMLGVAVLIIVMSVMNGFRHDIRDRILSLTPHAMVFGWQGPMTDWQSLGPALAQDKGVSALSPYIEGQGMLMHHKQMKASLIKGIDTQSVDGVFELSNALKAGSLEALDANPFGVILGQDLANGLNVTVGDKVTLVMPKFNVSLAGFSPRLKQLEVVGIFEIGYAYDGAYGFTSLASARKLFNLPAESVTGLQIKLNDPLAAKAYKARVVQQLPSNIAAIDWSALNSTYFQAVQTEKTMMFIILTLILVVAIFNLVSTLVMVVTDKKANIALLRTLGMTTSQVMRIFCFQGMIIGTIGTFLGTILGVWVTHHLTEWVDFIERLFKVKFLSAEVYFISYLPTQLIASDVVGIVLCALGLSFLATLYPAYRASHVLPAEALRHDG